MLNKMETERAPFGWPKLTHAKLPSSEKMTQGDKTSGSFSFRAQSAKDRQKFDKTRSYSIIKEVKQANLQTN